MNLTSNPARIAWIDLETTGLDTRNGDQLLQLAVIVTDKNFVEQGSLETKFYYSEEDTDLMKGAVNDYVLNMHNETGLWDALKNPMNPNHEDFDEILYSWLNEFTGETPLLFGGNSITLDREFMRHFLPKSYEVISYRSLDMSSVESFLIFTSNVEPFKKRLTHEALEDIRESIAQAVYHKNLLVPF